MKDWTPPEGYVEKKYNYTYKLTFKLDERYYYYGVHATNVNPYEDDYYGSGTNIIEYKKLYGKDCFNKEILEFFPTKKEALLAEDKLVPIELLKDPFCLNKIQGGGTFDTSGMGFSDEMREQIRQRFKDKKRKKESVEKMIATRRRRGTDKHSEETKRKLSEQRKGSRPMTKDGNFKIVYKDKIEEYLNDGWVIGYLPDRNEKIRQSKLGEKNPMYKKTPSRETIEKMLETKRREGTVKHSEETKRKLAELNRIHAKDPEFRKHLSECCKGVNIWAKGRIAVSKGTEETFIDKCNIEKYLAEGWTLGRRKGKRFIHKDDKVTAVYPEDLEKYLEDGWKLGRKDK